MDLDGHGRFTPFRKSDAEAFILSGETTSATRPKTINAHSMENHMTVCKHDLEPLLTSQEAADILNVKTGTLATWRSKKRYNLQYVKIGGRLVRYRPSEVMRFLVEEWMPIQPG